MHRRILPFIVLAVVISCSGDAPTEPGPDPLTLTYAPLIREMFVDGSEQHGGTVSFLVNPDDQDFRMPPASYFLMYVTTNHGESEVAQAQNMLCFDEEERPYTCHHLRVVLDAGANLEAVQSTALAADARLHWWFFLPDSAMFFSFGNTNAALSALRNHAAVAEATPYFLSNTSSTALSEYQRSAVATLRLHEGTPTQNDGRLTVNDGDSLFARVMQPGGYVTWRFGPLQR
jgi:hypothetical protein